MGSKRSAVILISYIYKNVKRARETERKRKEERIIPSCFLYVYVGILFNI